LSALRRDDRLERVTIDESAPLVVKTKPKRMLATSASKNLENCIVREK